MNTNIYSNISAANAFSGRLLSILESDFFFLIDLFFFMPNQKTCFNTLICSLNRFQIQKA